MLFFKLVARIIYSRIHGIRYAKYDAGNVQDQVSQMFNLKKMEENMKKKKVAKRIIAMTLAFTLCMQSAAVYAMDENDFQSITFEEEIDTENEDENYSVDQEDG